MICFEIAENVWPPYQSVIQHDTDNAPSTIEGHDLDITSGLLRTVRLP